ncbi:MAG: branched-chain amino acid ABC transporter permease [Candidatus Omnitrophota bacterium]
MDHSEIIFPELVNGITLGGIYALISLGYTMVYGVLLMINFSHSEIVMCGAFFGFFLFMLFSKLAFFQNNLLLTLVLVFIISMCVSGILGAAIERLAYRPLRKANRLMPFISAIGVSLFLQNLFMLAVSPQSKPFPEIFPERNFQFGTVTVSSIQIFIIAISISLMFILEYFVNRTKLGRAIRATSSDIETAKLMGINTDSIISLVFFIGAGLGGVAGILVGAYYGSIKYNMGFTYGIKAFTAAVLGGIGNIPGAMIGGYILGILESLGAAYISSVYKDAFAFIILILVLIFKPTGILGERVREKC